MDNTGKAVLLNMTSLYPKAQAINFSYPFDNGIRVIGWDYISDFYRIFYGDEIDLHFWALLKIAFGISSVPENPLTRQDGYLYEYNHKTKMFDVYDENGIRIIHKTDVRNIAQMNIDFTILNSHQFKIITTINLDGFVFMFPAILKKDLKPMSIEEYLNSCVQNIYINDRVRPYLPTDIDNPVWDIKYLALYDEMQKWARNGALSLKKYDEQIYRGLYDYKEISWEKNCPTNYFYMKELYEIEVKNLPDDITKVPPFDPIKPYKPGDYIRGNGDSGGGGVGPVLPPNVLYKVFSDSCQLIDEYGNYYNDPYRFIYTIKNTSRIFDFKFGKTYYVNDIIRIIEDGIDVFYLVKSQFIMTDWDIDIINTQKICTLLLEVKRFKKFTFFAEKLWLLYMQLGIGLYPDLMPIQRYNETQNNRPIYEPWLIWGFYRFLWNKKTTDWGDDFEIPLFDLSPNFS